MLFPPKQLEVSSVRSNYYEKCQCVILPKSNTSLHVIAFDKHPALRLHQKKKKEHTCKSWEKRSVYPLLYKQILTLLTDATAVHFWSLIALVEDRVKCACMNSLFALTQQCIYNRYHSNSTLNNDTLNASILESDAHTLQRGTEETILAANSTVKQ